MNLAEKIHERWQSNSVLEALLPVARFFTGNYFTDEPTLPYAIMTFPDGRPIWQHNDDSAVDAVTVRIQIVDDNYDDGLAILNAVKSAFNRQDFNLTGSDSVLTMERGSDTAIQDDVNGVWSFIIDFAVSVYLANGV